MGQRKLQSGLVTTEVILPPGLGLDTLEEAAKSLAGLNHPARLGGDALGRPTLVLEVLGLKGSRHYLLSYLPRFEPVVKSHLASMAKGVMFNDEFDALPDRWDFGLLLKKRSVDPPNEKQVPNLNAAFDRVGENEALLFQFVLAPHGRGDFTGDFLVSARVAFKGVEVRAKKILWHVKTSYGNLNIKTRRIPPEHMHRIASRWAPSTAEVEVMIHGVPIMTVTGWDYWTARETVIYAGLTGMEANRTQVPATPMVPRQGIVLGNSNYHGSPRPIAVAEKNLLTHSWILGPTGTGKSTMLHNLCVQLMEHGRGFVLIEPKGDLARHVLLSVPASRVRDVIWFDPTDIERPIGLNILAGPDPELTADTITSLFRNLYSDSWGARLEWILRYSVLTAALNGLTLYDVKQLLVNQDFRSRIVRATKHEPVREFWRRLEDGPDNAIDSVINKLDALVGFQAVRNIVGQTGGLDLAEVVTSNKILLCPLSPAIGEANGSMIGQVIVAQLWQQLLLRTEAKRKPFFLILDELQKYVGMSGVSLEDILTLGRSYQAGLIGANQQSGQMPKSMLATLRANARTKLAFSITHEDARTLAPDFAPMTADGLEALPQYTAAARIMTPDGLAPTATLGTLKPRAIALSGCSWSRRR